MLKTKASIAFIFVWLLTIKVEAKRAGAMVEDFEIGHLSGRRGIVMQGGLTVFKNLGGRGVVAYSYGHSKFFQSRPFLSYGGFLKEDPNLGLGYHVGFSLVENGKNFCMRFLVGPAGMMELPRRKVNFNLSLVGEMELEIGLGRRIDLLVGAGSRYIFFKSRLGRLAAHGSVGFKFNF